jgi:tRNA U34 5-carboxymethylaminomethyl modifying GTPase MnmE/TrmE
MAQLYLPKGAKVIDTATARKWAAQQQAKHVIVVQAQQTLTAAKQALAAACIAGKPRRAQLHAVYIQQCRRLREALRQTYVDYIAACDASRVDTTKQAQAVAAAQAALDRARQDLAETGGRVVRGPGRPKR